MFRYIIFSLFLSVSLNGFAETQTKAKEESKTLTADTIYKITKFVTWPHYALNNPNIFFCLYGDSVDIHQFTHLNNEMIQQKNVQVIKLDKLELASNCQVFYSPAMTSSTLNTIKGLSRNYGILVVSENENFANNGGMVELKNNPETIEIKINKKEVDSANLSVCSSLLNVVETVVEE